MALREGKLLLTSRSPRFLETWEFTLVYVGISMKLVPSPQSWQCTWVGVGSRLYHVPLIYLLPQYLYLVRQNTPHPLTADQWAGDRCGRTNVLLARRRCSHLLFRLKRRRSLIRFCATRSHWRSDVLDVFHAPVSLEMVDRWLQSWALGSDQRSSPPYPHFLPEVLCHPFTNFDSQLSSLFFCSPLILSTSIPLSFSLSIFLFYFY